MAQSKLALFLVAVLAALTFKAAAQVPPPPPPATGNGSNCDLPKLRVCANLLTGLVKVRLGLGELLPLPGTEQCCPLLSGIADLDGAVCLCTAVRANVLGVVNLNVPLAGRLLLNHCDLAVPANFTCPPA